VAQSNKGVLTSGHTRGVCKACEEISKRERETPSPKRREPKPYTLEKPKSRKEVILLVLRRQELLCREENMEMSLIDVTITAWSARPDLYGIKELKGVHPDTAVVAAEVAKCVALGYLKRTKPKHVALTPAGRSRLAKSRRDAT